MGNAHLNVGTRGWASTGRMGKNRTRWTWWGIIIPSGGLVQKDNAPGLYLYATIMSKSSADSTTPPWAAVPSLPPNPFPWYFCIKSCLPRWLAVGGCKPQPMNSTLARVRATCTFIGLSQIHGHIRQNWSSWSKRHYSLRFWPWMRPDLFNFSTIGCSTSDPSACVSLLITKKARKPASIYSMWFSTLRATHCGGVFSRSGLRTLILLSL